MALLIDGYNLLHVTGIFGKGEGPGGFQRSREALLRFLASSIASKELPKTTIVFDAADAPPGLPRTVAYEEMTVRYSTGYPDADALIEELIEQHASPRSLLVVSSDHRLQRAARRRRARFVDSDRWYADLWRQRVERRTQNKRQVPEKPVGRLSPTEIEYWVDQFADDTPTSPPKKDSPTSGTSSDLPDLDLHNPFPPGYGDDLL